MKQKENILSFTPKNFFCIDDKTSWDQEGIPPFYDIVIESKEYLEKVLSIAQN